MIHYEILRSIWFWRERWNVYSMGHLDGDRTWLASFRSLQDAQGWIGEQING